MSDKAEHLISKYLNEKMGISFGSLTVYDHTTVKKLVDFSIEKHLEDVLGEMENDFNQEQAVDLANKYANVCRFKSDFPHDYQSVVDGYSEGFKVGYQFALNHLKQRKG